MQWSMELKSQVCNLCLSLLFIFLLLSNIYNHVTSSTTGSEGRAGMAAIVGTEASVDLANLAKKLFLSLPVYAVPLFVRLLPEVELTGTFKLKKVQLRNEGFDINKVHDPLYVMDQQRKTYVPITPDLYQQISTGNARL